MAAHVATGLPVWLTPCHRHRFGKQPIPAEHRLTMLRLVAAKYSYAAVDNWEVSHRHDGSTFDALAALGALHPDKRFRLVIGADNAAAISDWHRGEELLTLYPCVVVGRGRSDAPAWCRPPHLFVPLSVSLSSTEVRHAIATGRHGWARGCLDERVWDYIADHKLYGFAEWL